MNVSIVMTMIVTALLTWAFMYLDARLFDTPKSKFAYFKGMLFVSGLSGLIVYFMGGASTAPNRVNMLQHGGVSYIPQIGEEILTGIPNF